jgi:hypothetical protein
MLKLGVASLLLLATNLHTHDAIAADADPSAKLWPIARAIQDFVDSPPLTAPSAFAENGWNRVADRLSALSDAELAAAKSDPVGFIRSLLAGKDRDAYCAQLDQLTSGGHIDVPIELMQTRDVAAALGPYVADLADFASSHPNAERLRQALMADIDKIVENDQLAIELSQFAEAMSSGLLVLPKPPSWPAGEQWPPTRDAMAAWTNVLRHVAPIPPSTPHVANSPAALKICSVSKFEVTSAVAIEEARKPAQLLTKEVEAWAKQYASLSSTATMAPAAPKLPTPKSISVPAATVSSSEWTPPLPSFPQLMTQARMRSR